MQYIQWRFQDGHDRELLEKATRVLTDEEKALLDQEQGKLVDQGTPASVGEKKDL